MSTTTAIRPRAAVTLGELTFAWLWQYRESRDTREAYERDLKQYAGWAAVQGVEVTAVTRVQLDQFAAWLSLQPGRGGRTLAANSVARKLSAVSSWYDYLVDAGVIAANPCARVRRPRFDRDVSKTVGLSAAEATRLREAAVSDPVLLPQCAVALAGFLVEIGARVSEVCALDVTDLGADTGHRTVTLAMKGGKVRVRAVPPSLGVLLDTMINGSSAGPLFVTRDGRRLDRHDVKRFVKRAARAAGLVNWNKISPHSCRHAWTTIARLAGATLEDRQFALGHRDPRTTQRYDRAKLALARDPSYLVAAATAA